MLALCSRGRAGRIARGGASQAPSLPFVTTFPTAESPITFGGYAKNGKLDGIDWQNFDSDGSGKGYGAAVSSTVDDCTITLQGYPGLSTTKQYVKAKVFRAVGYTPVGQPEVEIRIFTTISANSIAGYELDFPWTGQLQMIMWNGPLNNFRTTGFTVVSGFNPTSPASGVEIGVFAEIVTGKPQFTIFYDGVQQIVYRDDGASPALSGYPGLGAFTIQETLPDMKKWCFSRFEAGNW